MHKGHLKSWRRDRGFGFIKVDGRDSDVFVHISELRSIGRPPRIGDEISFDIESQEDGKERAINCKVKGAKSQSSENSSSNNSIIIGAVVVVAIAVCCYLYLFS